MPCFEPGSCVDVELDSYNILTIKINIFHIREQRADAQHTQHPQQEDGAIGRASELLIKSADLLAIKADGLGGCQDMRFIKGELQ